MTNIEMEIMTNYDYHDFHDSISIALSAATMAGSSEGEA